MSKVDKNELIRLYGEGLGINRLATHFGVSINAVYKHVKALGLSDGSRIPTLKVNEDELRKLVAEGLGYHRISRVLNVNRGTVEKHMRRLGLNDPTRQFQPSDKSRRARRPKSVEFTATTRKTRFIEEGGICQECKLLIHDGLNWRLATYHHIQLASRGGTADPANCMVLHTECHEDPVVFERLHGFHKARMEARFAGS